ncbi:MULTISPECIES: Ppx/GppA phosphatase family protein [unclassified Idiomarina]|uniref:Ppx/GppA phosphatase family protein n=1 Tax=unclassified Idiomarina TaxID=2614829 RepID=UPI000C8F2490|nr:MULTISPECIES: Ppx/GppA family phosphatase [unclassified Idiomarina]MAD53336.1 phosphatase [Idiomarinaceae bacterium]MEC7643462.1 Ppx/GppA family phosphatase [Pseudomonadota bacterium]NQZ04744.1 Ppx/GppA family phosphatase [Idiomarina sp.]|tara:strand:+ start:986 stop:1924 length:939 start_codon:yes stop_codon:yes gene_type:complete
MTSNSRRIAAIDLGSNSFHLLLAEMVTRGGIESPRIIKRVKQKVRLADGFDASRNISQQGIDRAKACLSLFHDEIVQFGAGTIKAVATAAMRQANNQADVLQALEASLKFPIEIITGLREAELIYAGVTSTARSRGDTLVIDIGGASTEVIAGHDRTPKLLHSFDMGCVVFQNNYFPEGIITRSRIESAQAQVRNQLSHYQDAFKRLGWTRVIGASGTFRAVYEIAQANQHDRIDGQYLSDLVSQCVQAGTVNNLKLFGLRDDRKPIFLGGLVILATLVEQLGIHAIEITNGALREGLLAEISQPNEQLALR